MFSNLQKLIPALHEVVKAVEGHASVHHLTPVSGKTIPGTAVSKVA